MNTSAIPNKKSAIPEFLLGGGELGQLIRAYDWESTPLGPVEGWPQSLRTCVRIMLTSRQPIWIGWGKQLIKLYNDPYKAIVGGKHPWALGKPASVVWKDIWRDIDPMLKQVMENDQGTFAESQLLIMERNGYAEETYYTFSYTPIPGDDGTTAGMICANSDDTNRIISERQLKTLTQLGKNLIDVNAASDVINKALATLQDNPFDFPFALFYNISGDSALLFASTADELLSNATLKEINLTSSNDLSVVFSQAIVTRKPQVFESRDDMLANMPKGAWAKPPGKLLVLPVSHSGSKETHSFFVVGCNPYRLPDDTYKAFFMLVVDQIATSLASVHSREEERKRAQALAEIDRAKTTFFSNISHEFRTPLTLLLGPVEETLQFPEKVAETRARMEVAYRNALRLQRMVNTLLEFSRIEAGRMDGKFSLVDICKFTNDLASTFRAAIEKAGMQLLIHCKAVTAEVYVDTEMWERIMLNLLSNAFKYSKTGRITVEVEQTGNEIQVSVADTGIGIPADQLDKIFDRFHRVENMEGRSKEGTGIGLAMVKELVKFHGGAISVKSKVGVGSVFTVSIPTGKLHIAADKVVNNPEALLTSVHADSFLLEASRWVSPDNGPQQDVDTRDEHAAAIVREEKRYSVLLADDNADMREYVQRLLNRQFNVIVARDGAEAFDKLVKHKPDLLLSDVMMPVLDGFGLLKKVRNHAEIKNTPVILLSARAGEEAKIDGLKAGADDYLVKPFSAKELIARVEANIKIAKSRVAAENNLKNVIMQSPVAMTMLKGPELIIEIANEKALELWGKKREEVINKPLLEAFKELDGQGFSKILGDVFYTGRPFTANEMPVSMVRHGQYQKIYINFIFEPLRDIYGNIEGVIAVGINVSEQVTARQSIQQSEEKARLAIEAADLGTYEVNLQTDEMKTSHRFNQIWGVSKNVARKQLALLIHPDDLEIRQKAHAESLLTGNLQYEARIIWKDNSQHWLKIKGKIIYGEDGAPKLLIGVIQDITEQKQFAEQLTRLVNERTTELQRSNDDLQQFAHVASHDLKEPVRKIMTYTQRLEDEYGDIITGQGKGFIQKVHHATNRMLAMIDGVLRYSKINADLQSVEDIDLNEIFSDIEMDLEVVIKEKGALINRHHLAAIQGARVLIYQLFYNLVNNSLKFAKKNVQPVIAVTSTLVFRQNVRYAMVGISDNGIGFEQQSAEKIFNTFTRLNSKDKYEGTGLGLALCKKIVERHHGQITAEGQKDIGATFTVFLPVKQQQISL